MKNLFLDMNQLSESEMKFMKDYEKYLDDKDPLLSCIINLRAFVDTFSMFGLFPDVTKRFDVLVNLLEKVRNEKIRDERGE